MGKKEKNASESQFIFSCFSIITYDLYKKNHFWLYFLDVEKILKNCTDAKTYTCAFTKTGKF